MSIAQNSQASSRSWFLLSVILFYSLFCRYVRRWRTRYISRYTRNSIYAHFVRRDMLGKPSVERHFTSRQRHITRPQGAYHEREAFHITRRKALYHVALADRVRQTTLSSVIRPFRKLSASCICLYGQTGWKENACKDQGRSRKAARLGKAIL